MAWPKRAGRFAIAGLARPIPTPAVVLALVGLAVVVRLAFAFRAPPFVTNDSQSYLLPGYDLAHGLGFAPAFKRPPAYPVFIAGVQALFGEELRVLALVQHLLGVLTVVGSFALGWLVFGRAAGIVAGLLTAFSGPLLVTERYLMSETFFGLFITAALVAYVAGVLRGQPSLLGLAGALLGVAALTRPIAQLIALMLTVALIVFAEPGRGRERARWWGIRAAPLVLGFLIVVAPWIARNAFVHGSPAIAGGLGEGLAVRTIRYDQQFDFRDPSEGDSDRLLARARRVYREEARDGSAFELSRRVRDELGVSEPVADGLLRRIALTAILARPIYYAWGTLDMFAQTLIGHPVRLRQDWLPWRNIGWAPRVQHLLPRPSPVEERTFVGAERITTIFDPARIWPLIAGLMLVGWLSGLAAGRRMALVLGAVVLLVLLVGAAVIGIEWRYRYPFDPTLNVLAAGGLGLIAGKAVSSSRSWLGRGRPANVGKLSTEQTP